MKLSRSTRWFTGTGMMGWMLALVALTMPTAVADSRRSGRSAPREFSPSLLGPRRDQRMVLVLPVQLGEGWQANPKLADAILPGVNKNLRLALLRTGGYAVVMPHRFEPILMRAVQDRAITQDQLDTLVDEPTLENAQLVLTSLGLSQPPLIATFMLEQIGGQGSGVQVQASGRLYELGNDTALKTSVVTGKSQGSLGGLMVDNSRSAASDAVTRAAAEMMALPLEDIGLLPGASTGGAVTLPGDVPIEGATTRPPSGSRPGGVVLPGDVPATGASERPPSNLPRDDVVLPGDVPIEGASSRPPSSAP